MTTGRTRERRWMVLGEDGRHVWLGRHSDPTEEELLQIERSLASAGTGGWLVVMQGDYWDGSQGLEMLVVRRLGHPDRSDAEAIAAFKRLRLSKLEGAGD